MKIRGSVVVIAGASSGIGRAVALDLARRGGTLVLGARRVEALETLADQCRRHRGAQAVSVPTDISDPAAVAALAQRAVDLYGRIDVWVNAAAVGAFGRVLDVPLTDVRRVLDVNVVGCLNGVRAALLVMRRQGRGLVVDVASVVAVTATPYNAAYVMSKHAVRALDACVRQELWLEKARNIHICTVLPATIDTPFYQHAANRTGRRPRAMPPVYTPERVAHTVRRLVRRPRREVVVGPLGRVLVLGSRVTPGLVEKAVALLVDRTQLEPEGTAPDGEGILYQPASAPGSVRGGWHGGVRSGRRRVFSAAAVSAAVKAATRRRRAEPHPL